MTSPLELMETYRAGGVNRISLGVQSMSAHVLASLGRTHDQRNVATAIEAIKASGMPSFNLDLIYGAAGESIDDWRRTVQVPGSPSCEAPKLWPSSCAMISAEIVVPYERWLNDTPRSTVAGRAHIGDARRGAIQVLARHEMRQAP